jgi:hypothetical protein
VRRNNSADLGYRRRRRPSSAAHSATEATAPACARAALSFSAAAGCHS